jgi:putative ABC transport system permease protein
MRALQRLWNIVRRPSLDDELRQEIDTHLALIEEEERGHGSSAEQARQRARARFGSPLGYRERSLDAVIATWVEGVGQELVFAARRLTRSPAFTLASVLTLALAIGANASIFAVVHRVVLNPLPYPDSNQLIDLDHGASPSGANVATGIQMTSGLYDLYLSRSRTLDGIALYRPDEQTLAGGGEPERIRIAFVTASLAYVLRIWPLRGRWFTDVEGVQAPINTPRVPVVSQVGVMSYRLWMRRYGGDPSILSRTVTLGGVPTGIVGIMPPAYAFPDPRVDVWIPEQVKREPIWDTFMHAGVARARDGVTAADVRAELTGLIADLPRAYPNDATVAGFMKNLKLRSAARTLKDAIVGGVERALWILLASVGLVLLVACANVANLFLVRSEARRREVAVRRALGAGRLGIARYFLAESLLLSSAGAVLGLALAWGGVRLLVTLGPTNLPRLGEVQLDGVIAVFALALTVLTAAVFGSMPMLRVAPLAGSLHDGGRSQTASRTTHRARQLMMGGQVALALVLLASSGLMVRSFQKLRAIDLGFDARSALTFRVGLPPRDYPNQPAVIAAQRAILDRLAALPGVTAASASTCLPLAEEGICFASPMRVEGRVPVPGVLPPIVAYRAVAGGYLDTIGIRLIRGRGITRADDERGEPIAVVNQALASAYFPNQDPIGQRVTVGPPLNRLWLTIVGIVANTPVRALAEPSPTGQLFLPMSLARSRELPVTPDAAAMGFIVRTSTPPLGLVPSVRRAIDDIDKNLALAQVRTLEDTLDRASAQMAFTMVLLAIAASVALLLGVIGIYGVMSYVVSQRTGEIGVRLALGAEPSSVALMIVRQGGVVALAGIGVGLATAVAGSRLIESLLYGISPRDPGVFAATTLVLLGVALIACWLPARRAARLSPLEALKTE